jgi:hypothetical protein
MQGYSAIAIECLLADAFFGLVPLHADYQQPVYVISSSILNLPNVLLSILSTTLPSHARDPKVGFLIVAYQIQIVH